jgi:hypothetical protein
LLQVPLVFGSVRGAEDACTWAKTRSSGDEEYTAAIIHLPLRR